MPSDLGFSATISAPRKPLSTTKLTGGLSANARARQSIRRATLLACGSVELSPELCLGGSALCRATIWQAVHNRSQHCLRASRRSTRTPHLRFDLPVPVRGEMGRTCLKRDFATKRLKSFRYRMRRTRRLGLCLTQGSDTTAAKMLHKQSPVEALSVLD